MPATKPERSALDIRRSLGIQRVFFNMIGKPFLRSLVIPLFALLLSIGMADAATDWGLLRSRVAALPAWEFAALCTSLMLAWSMVSGRAFRGIWLDPFMAFLVRQPLEPRHWVVYLSPSIAVALVPIAGIAWLAPHDTAWPVHYLGFFLLAWPLVVGSSFKVRDAILPLGIGTLTCFLALLAYAFVPALWYGVLVPAGLSIGLSVTPIRRQIAQINRARYSPLSGSGIIATIARRDLRYLLRTQKKQLIALGILGALCSLLMLAFRINGSQAGHDALLSACTLYSVSIYTVYEILELLKQGLGKELMRRRWPVTHSQRAQALALVNLLLVAPSATLVLICGATMGAVNAVVFVLFVATTIALASGLLCHSLLIRSSANGLFLLGITGNAVAILALPAWAYAVLAVAVTPVAYAIMTRGLNRFSLVTERISIDQLA
ncbi:MAG: hypothetical protein PVH89_04320 [Gammaproteobacteria bacterium]